MSNESDWIEIMDEKRGRPYFHDKLSGSTTWTRPEGVSIRQVQRRKTGPLPKDWKEMFDKNHNRPYFVNMSTGQSTWVRPQAAESTQASNSTELKDEPSPVQAQPAPILTAAPIPSPIASSSVPDPVTEPAEKRAPAMEREESPPKQNRLIAALPPEVAADIHKFKMRDFAQAHFQKRKKGLFRRIIPPEEVLRFQNTPISKPLLRLSSQSSKLACASFRLILGYMGERSGTRGDSLFLAKSLVQNGLENPELRDEIFVQLVKQTNGNSNKISAMRGWELMLLIASSYPPSKDLESYFLNYLVRHMTGDDHDSDIQAYAKLSVNRLKRIMTLGPRGKVWTAEEIDSLKDLPFQPIVFGVAIDDIMEGQKEKGINSKIPHVLTVLADSVLQSDGLQTEGVFRLPGDMDEVARYKVQFDKGNYSLPKFDLPHVPASLLKLWMRDLAEPIIPESLYDKCLEVSSNETESLAVLNDLPPVNRGIVEYVINFLQKFAEPEIVSVTKMGVENLAMVFSPNLLRCPSQDPNVILDCSRKEQAFLRHLIHKLK